MTKEKEFTTDRTDYSDKTKRDNREFTPINANDEERDRPHRDVPRLLHQRWVFASALPGVSRALAFPFGDGLSKVQLSKSPDRRHRDASYQKGAEDFSSIGERAPITV